MLKRRIYGQLPVVRPLVSNKKNKAMLSVFLLITVVCFSVGLNILWFKTTKAAAVTWVGGVDLDWCTDANWSSAAEPTSADDVTISAPGVLDVGTSGCVTEGHSISFNTLTIGDGATSNNLTLTASIATGGSITVKNAASLIQGNNSSQTISGTLTVQNGGLLTHSDNAGAQAYTVDFQAATINIDSGATVNVDARGYDGGLSIANGLGTGPGVYEVAGGDGSGGAHSGAGGATLGSTAGGTAYCNNNNPNTQGSGGGGANGGVGGDGGGLVRLKATGTITMAGTITVDGANGGTGGAGKFAGGGAGGGVKLDAATVNISSGTITATGGNGLGTPPEGGGGGGGCVFINYTTAYTWTGSTTSTAAGTGANSGGAGSYISNAAPTVTTPSASQTATSTITATATIADLDSNITNMIVDYSTNGTTWASSTLGAVTPSEGAVTTSTGSIFGIDTNLDGSVNLTVEWNVGVDAPNTDDTSVYLRFVPADSIVTSTAVSSAAFAIDTKDPTAPGNLSVSSTSTNAVILKFGSATVDTGFREYKVFYSTATPVTLSASSLTSSTDANLGLIDYNSKTTTTVSSLLENTKYYANIWAYDRWDRTASSSAEASFYTLSDTPTNLATTTIDTASVGLSVDTFPNHIAGSSGYFFGINRTSDNASISDSGWMSGMATLVTVNILSPNVQYTAGVRYRNGDSIETATTTLNFHTLASVPSAVAATVNSASQITVSWTGDGTTYYAENITAGTNSGWITASSHAFTNLTAGTAYSFRVKAISGGGAETSWSSTVSATTQSEGGGGPLPNPPGGGGADPPPPLCEGQECQPKKPTGQVGGYVLINDDAAKTTGANVNLNLYFTKFVSTYAVTEVNAHRACDFSGKSFGDIGAFVVFNNNYNTKVAPFTLSANFGARKICVRYRGSLDGGKNFVDYDAFDTILFEEISEPELPPTEPKKPPLKPPLPENPPVNPPENPPEQPKEPVVPPPAAPPAQPPAQPSPAQPPANPQPGPQPGPIGGGEPENPSQPSGSSDILETAVGVSNVVKETAGIINVLAVEPVIEAAKVTIKAIKKAIDNPKVEKANEIAVAPAIVIAGAANVAVGFNATQVLIFLRHIFTQPLLLLRLRKRKSWGVIYNALNKMPVDLAVVRLIEESTGRIVQSQVTDAQGRYLISVEPGEYHLEVDKTGFFGFSKLLRDKDEDAKFIHLYHGGKFQVTETEIESVLNYNIPLDPIDEIKGNNLIIREYTKKATQNIICVIGLVASLLSFVISPKLIIFAFVLLHLIFYWLFYRFSHRKVTAGSFGSVTEMIMEEPISKAVVRVLDSMYNKLVDTAVTDRKGRYAVLVGPSKYYTTYEKDGFEKKQSEVLDFSSEKTNGMGGLINRDEELKKVSS